MYWFGWAGTEAINRLDVSVAQLIDRTRRFTNSRHNYIHQGQLLACPLVRPSVNEITETIVDEIFRGGMTLEQEIIDLIYGQIKKFLPGFCNSVFHILTLSCETTLLYYGFRHRNANTATA